MSKLEELMESIPKLMMASTIFLISEDSEDQ